MRWRGGYYSKSLRRAASVPGHLAEIVVLVALYDLRLRAYALPVATLTCFSFNFDERGHMISLKCEGQNFTHAQYPLSL